MDKVFTYTKTTENKRVEKTFSIELKNIRKAELIKELDNKNATIYTGISDALTNQMFKKEINDA